MSNENENEKKPLSLRGKLELTKNVEAGQVRQSFSHGRSKAVTVEVKKKRSFTVGSEGAGNQPSSRRPDAGSATSSQTAEALLASGALAGLTEEERLHRINALQAANRRAEEEASRRKAEEDAERRRVEEEAARRKAEEDERRRVEEEARRAEASLAASQAAPEQVSVERSAPEEEPVVSAPVEPVKVPESKVPESKPQDKAPRAVAPPQQPAKPQTPPRPSIAPMTGVPLRPQVRTMARPGMAQGQGQAAQGQGQRPSGQGAGPRPMGQGAGSRSAGQQGAASRSAGQGQGQGAASRPAGQGMASRPAGQQGTGPRPQGASGTQQGQRSQTGFNREGARRDGNAPRGGAPRLDPTAILPPVESPTGVTKESARPRPVTPTVVSDEDDDRRKGAGKAPVKAAPKKVDDGKRRGKLTINAALNDEEGQRGRSKAAMLRAAQKERRKAQQQQSHEKVVREVVVPDTITVQELANRMAERAPNVIKSLMKLGVLATINQVIDADTAELVAQDFGHTVKRVSEADIEVGLETGPDDETQMVSRPPVVTVMGHVDHGKTSLLDALRETDVVSGEAGGITQHIGAYQVKMHSGKRITFIDTPGHEAFTAMRARGAKVTDIVVLVVAADDGIMPQTVEAIRHAKAAEVPVVVAINKIDKPGADPSRVRSELLQHEIVLEELGGETLAVEVSAKKRLNLDKLEEAILLQAEVLDLKANPSHAGEGSVVEAKMEKGRGSVATVLVRRGTLRVGDIFVAGKEWGRVRAMLDDKGERVEEAGPATPVEILGLQGVPAAGDDFIVVDDEARARDIAAYRQRKEREAQAVKSARGTMEQMFAKIQAGEAKELPVVIKGDVQGSVEALIGTLDKIGTDDVRVKVLHAAVGAINESDITLAKASEAVVIGFNVRANPQARDVARRDGIDIRYYSIIYDVAEDMKRALTGMLEPVFKEKFIGYAAIRDVFNITKVGKVAGCMVTEGIIKRGCKVRLLRDNVVIHEGDLGQLKRFKDDVKDVREGFECGMSFANYHDIQVGDVIECFEMEEIAAEL